jgi:uncharacterized protein (DUF1778 family)
MNDASMRSCASRSGERVSVSMTSDDRELIAAAAKSAGIPVPVWVVQVAREEARWAVAYQIASELADEAGVTAEDLAWARSALGLDAAEE